VAKLPKLKYVKFVRSKGNLYAYFNTGKKVAGKTVYNPLPPYSSVGFHDSYNAMMGHRTRRENVALSVQELADLFENSPEFGRLAKGTQKYYSLGLKRICEQIGPFPLDKVERRHVREIVNNRIEGNGARNAFLAVLGVLYTFGRRRELTELEPTKDIQQFPLGQHEPWGDDLLAAGLSAEHDRTRLAINLLYYTGQRIGDVVAMRWSDIRNGAIALVQQKTGKPLLIPLHSALEAELARTPKKGITIITNQLGQPMTPQVIRRELKAFGEAMGATVVPHGLRKNAVNSLLEAGCTIAEVAAITGQTFKVIEHYARRSNQKRLGEAAILKLENVAGKFKPSGKTAGSATE
jgi:integrase